jgi:diguanylate cyclase (GGDEF)-like protein
MAADVHDLQAHSRIGKAKGLLHSLVPRAQCFCFYDQTRDCVWSSDGAEDYEIDNYISDLPEELVAGEFPDSDYLQRSLPSGRTVLVLPVRDDEGKGQGLLVSVFSRNTGKSSSFNAKLLSSILLPAVELIGESLLNDERLDSRQSEFAQLEKELDLIYEVDEKIHGASRSHVGLAHLVGQSGRFLGINYSVLLIPSKRIRISATHSSWKHVRRKVLDRYLVEQLLPKLEGRRWPVVFEIPTVDGADNSAGDSYQALLCPLHDKRGNIEGVLAQLGRIDNRSFDKNDRRFMAHIMRKIEYVIERSFDSMTGLMNREGFESQLSESAQALEPQTNDEHQLVYFDLDNLQLVNDTFGRAAGDAVILRFARLLEEDLPKSAVLSRLTGDDFCLLLTHVDAEAALAHASKIREQGRTLRYLEGDKSLQVTMSVGIATMNSEVNEREALTAARMACEAAKDHGRDRIEVYDDQNQSIIRRYDDMQLVTDIQQALDEDSFELLAQPIVSLADDREELRYEILLRMYDSKGERVPTEAFFSAAERYQLMPQIDRWVVSRTIARLAACRERVEELTTSFSINLSGQSLGDDDILDFIDDELRSSGVPANILCFEVTESAAVSNLAKAQSFIDALRERGCLISLDDFGAGLSSFAYLKNFNVDTLKIDGSFVRDIAHNRISESMVAAITEVAKVMGLETVAEYVESDEIRAKVKAIGVDFAQGHAVGKPVGIDDALDALSDLEKSETA